MKTFIDIGNGYQILFHTDKNNGHLVTNARRVKIENADGVQIMSFAIFTDWRATVNVVPCKRATDKAIRAAHEEALKRKDEMIEHCHRWYAARA